MRLEVEKQALKKESEDEDGSRTAKARVKEIDRDVAELKEKTSELESRWKNEKQVLQDIKSIKKELEILRLEADAAELAVDLLAQQKLDTEKSLRSSASLNKNKTPQEAAVNAPHT